MNRKHWLILLGALLALALVVAAIFLLRPSAPPLVSLSPSPLVTLSPTSPPPTQDWGDLPTLTPPGPGEPTVPPEALAMRAAPTATQGEPLPPPPSVTPSPTRTPFPTLAPVPATGQDDVPMVEIPAGKFIMGTTCEQARMRESQWTERHPGLVGISFIGETPRLIVDMHAFAIDKYEVTNARYRACVTSGICQATRDCSPIYPEDYNDNTRYDNYPVAGVSWYDAAIYCHWVGKRLPTEAEWEKAARGSDGRPYPWGDVWHPDYVGQSLEPVGSHPESASPYGVHDLIGVAGEWTADVYQPYPGNQPGGWSAALYARGYRVLRGMMSAVIDEASSRTSARNGMPPDRVCVEVNFRCVHSMTPPPILSERVVQVDAVATPQPVTTVDLSQMVYVPAGPFVMGTDDVGEEKSRQDETPTHIVHLDAFYIDRYEVTWANYARFLDALEGSHYWACSGYDCAIVRLPGAPHADSVYHILLENGRYVVDHEFENYPIDSVSWYGADAYCVWQGKRLPTEAEWEKAARGTDGRLFPWGNEWDPRGATDMLHPHAVGSQAINVSPYGVYDMLGNVDEWVADWYAADYYMWSPAHNPQGPPGGIDKVARSLGGDPVRTGGLLLRQGSKPSYLSTGFRCAYTP